MKKIKNSLRAIKLFLFGKRDEYDLLGAIIFASIGLGCVYIASALIWYKEKYFI